VQYQPLYPLCIAGKTITLLSILLGILFLTLTAGLNSDFFRFFEIYLAIPCIIFFVDLIFLAVLLSFKGEQLLSKDSG
jgi:hypothetical protein